MDLTMRFADHFEESKKSPDCIENHPRKENVSWQWM